MDIYIDDAGIGCPIGKAVIVGIKDNLVEYSFLDNKSPSEVTFEVLKKLDATKNDTIHLCRGNVFHGFEKEAVSMGYSIVREQIQDKEQDIVEDIFMESLYQLGLSRTVKLEGKNYTKLHFDIFNEIFINPELIKLVRVNWTKTRQFNHVFRQLDRLTNEFPHLYKEMLSSEII